MAAGQNVVNDLPLLTAKLPVAEHLPQNGLRSLQSRFAADTIAHAGDLVEPQKVCRFQRAFNALFQRGCGTVAGAVNFGPARSVPAAELAQSLGAVIRAVEAGDVFKRRSEEHTSEL